MIYIIEPKHFKDLQVDSFRILVLSKNGAVLYKDIETVSFLNYRRYSY